MYNSATEQKIKNIPPIGDIDIDRLPQELTRIYAQIVSLRRQVVDGTINFQDGGLISAIELLSQLANNLETILLVYPHHEKKESIAFVAGTANNLIYKIGMVDIQNAPFLEIDSISPHIAAIILFLIGNSQADASETANIILHSKVNNVVHDSLINNIIALGTGKLANVIEINEDIIDYNDVQEAALNFLWLELGLGIVDIVSKLKGNSSINNESHFDKVIDLAKSDVIFDQRSVFAGPYRLAKLLKMLQEDIFLRAVVTIPCPLGVDANPWDLFLKKLANERPYLWENHRDAIDQGFLNLGTSAVITLPTGAGKSTLSELKIATCIYSGKRAIYLVPTHALEDQVSRNLNGLFTEFEKANLEFGNEYTEIQGAEDSPIIIMTPERCLTLLNTDPDSFNDIGLVVFDEFHLIHGVDLKKDSRSIDAMYCLLSLFTTIPKADYLLISAMVENGDEISNWIKQITGRECLLFNSTWKPTRQLHGCLVFAEPQITALKRNIRFEQLSKQTKGPSKKLKDSMLAFPECFFSMKNIWETTENEDYFRAPITDEMMPLGIGSFWNLTSNRNQIAAKLGVHFAKLGFKTLIFVDNPIVANSTAQAIAKELSDNSRNYLQYLSENANYINSLTLELGDLKHSYFQGCENVGVHHGLLLSVERNLIEKYFKRSNGASNLVATATLAQGINLPAEIVIIAGDDRFDEDGGNREKVKAHELLNAAGRAGRAGQSAQGAVILIPGEIVTIEDQTISHRWWELKNEVFSKGDQCLKIEDPLQYFLDSLQDSSEKLDNTQISILYRFKSEVVSEKDTTKLLKNSFYAYKAAKMGESEKFEKHLRTLLDMKSELDQLSENIDWTREISFKTGIDPVIIQELGNAIDGEDFDMLCSLSTLDLVNWFVEWVKSNEKYLFKVFTKQSTINQIKRTIGLKYDTEYPIKDILAKFDILKKLLSEYMQGRPLNEIDKLIPNSTKLDASPYLKKARNFVIRLIPDLSFGFGLFSLVVIEKAKQKGVSRKDLPENITTLASCVREGFDSVEKLSTKKYNRDLMRVETHLIFNNQ